MTLKEARARTKYFAEGVTAEIWCYSGDGNWAIRVSRDGGHVSYLGIDQLKRRAHFLKTRIESGSKDLRLINEKYEYPEDEISFDSADSAAECLPDAFARWALRPSHFNHLADTVAHDGNRSPLLKTQHRLPSTLPSDRAV